MRAALALLAALLAAPPAAAVTGRSVVRVDVPPTAAGESFVMPGEPADDEAVSRALRAFHARHPSRRLEVWADDDADGVRLKVVAEPVRTVARLQFLGVRALSSEALQKAAGLSPGTEYSAERLDDAARSVGLACRRAGYRDAVVRWDAKAAGAEVHVDFSLAEGAPTRLAALVAEGDTGLPAARLEHLAALRAGDVLNLDRLDGVIENWTSALRREGFGRARVDAPDIEVVGALARVRIRVRAGPRVDVRFSGVAALPARVLGPLLEGVRSQTLDDGALRRLAAEVQRLYAWRGFPQARVHLLEQDLPAAPSTSGDAPPAGRLVTLRASQGPLRRVVRRRYPGLSTLTADELDRRLDAMLEQGAPAGLLQADAVLARAGEDFDAPAPSELYVAEVYEEACEELQALYRTLGRLDARVGPARLVPSPAGDVLELPVAEGPLTLVRERRLEGLGEERFARFEPLLLPKPGQPLDEVTAEASRQMLEDGLRAEGFLQAQVEQETRLSRDRSGASLVWRVTEGPLVRIDEVRVTGAGSTDPLLVKQALLLGPGDVPTPAARDEAVRRLLSTGAFAAARVELSKPEVVEPSKDLLVDLTPKPRLTAELRGGASYADGPRAAGVVTWNNLRGRGWTAALTAKLNWPVLRFCLVQDVAGCTSETVPRVPLERRLNASLVVPGAPGPKPLELRLDAVHERLLRPSYDLSRVALLASTDGLWRRRLGPFATSMLLQAELERDVFGRIARTCADGTDCPPLVQTLADRRALLLPDGDLVLASLKPSWTLDARDDRLRPTIGMLAGATLDLSRSLTATDKAGQPYAVELARLLVSASGYMPLSRGRRVVLAVSGRAGGILRVADSQVVGTKRFFLGGNQSLRGFNEDAVYPEDVRERLHAAFARCRALASGLGCDDTSRRLAGGEVDSSPGGTLSLLVRSELR
ncbi:MAG: hypothetical protein RL199_849, partial [Pseudomonadota bacterium]